MISFAVAARRLRFPTASLFVRVGIVDEASGSERRYPDGIKLGPDGNFYIGQYSKGRIVVVDKDGKFVKAIDVPSPTRSQLAFSPDGKTLYVMASRRHGQRALLGQGLRGAAAIAAPGAADHGAWKPIALWVPSQNGFFEEWPQRQNQAFSTRSTLRPVPDFDLELAGDHQRPVDDRLDLDRTDEIGDLQLALLGCRLAGRDEAAIDVRVVAIGLVARQAAAAERGAKADLLAVDAQIGVEGERSVLAHHDDVDDGGRSFAPPSLRVTWIAPEGQLWATRISASGSAASASIHGPSTFALKTLGSPITQRRAWMQRCPSNVMVAFWPSTVSTLMIRSLELPLHFGSLTHYRPAAGRVQ